MGSVRFQYGVKLAPFFLHKNPSSAQFRSARGHPCRLYIVVPIILMFTLCFELRGSNQNRMFSTETRGFKPWKILKGLGGAGTHDIPNASRYIPWISHGILILAQYIPLISLISNKTFPSVLPKASMMSIKSCKIPLNRYFPWCSHDISMISHWCLP